jgi:hypothetical protein
MPKLKWKFEPCSRCGKSPQPNPKCMMCRGTGFVSRPVTPQDRGPKKAVWWARW